MPATMGSLFDGIGGFVLAGSRHGIQTLWASEIEAFPIRVTQHHFPEMLHVGDITKLDGAKLPPVDIICGGSPCQDLSVAGRRAGLEGERSGLFMEQIRVIKEMRDEEIRRGRAALDVRPRYGCWENVPGAFSSGDPKCEDFRIVLEEFLRIGDSTLSVPRPPHGRWQSAGAILGDRCSVAWRVYDTQYWPGTPQRRRRIYLVADFAGLTAHQVLFEQHRLLGDTAPSGDPWQGAAAAASPSIGNPSGAGGEMKEEKQLIGFDGYNGDLTGDTAATLGVNCGMSTGRNGVLSLAPTFFAANQRDEVRDLHDVAGAVQAQPGMKQQTFVLNPWDTQQARISVPEGVAPSLCGADGGGRRNPAGLIMAAGFCAGAGSKAQGIGYQEELSPTLKSGGGNGMPSILCVNDQGGQVMSISENVSGTLRAQEHGHQPLVLASQQGGAEIGVDLCPTITAAAGMSGNSQPVLFESHPQDARYKGPLDIAPTVRASYGEGGNNTSLIAQPETFCIAGNAIDRQPHNGGNGLGFQPDISYTLTSCDRHSVFSQQRSDEYIENAVASTQSARQYKDATDLIYQKTVGTLVASDKNGPNNQYVGDDKCIIMPANFIRRLTPLECERLQGFPDFWTDIPGASDSARYKALGNSVSIPVVSHVLRGVAFFLKGGDDDA